MRRMKCLLCVSAVCLMVALAACIHVEMIDMTNRPLYSPLRVTFNWEGQEEEAPERMHIIAVRNVKTWRAHGFVDTDNGREPWFGYSEPLIEEVKPEEPEPEVPETPEEEPEDNPETPETPDNPENPDEPDVPGTGDDAPGDEPSENDPIEEGGEPGDEPEEDSEEQRYPFLLKGGEYNMLFVNYGLNTGNLELKCLKDGEEIDANGNTNQPEGTQPEDTQSEGGTVVTPEQGDDSTLKSYLTDYNRKVNELFLCIKPEVGDPPILFGKDLPDFNPQFDYVEKVPRIFYGLATGVHAVPGTDTEVTVDMRPISQEVKVIFKVRLNGDIEIREEPVVELSGICGHFNLMEAYVDTTELYRSVVEAELIPEKSTADLKYYEASFHTLGIVPSYDETYLNGPGIFQVAVKAASTKPDAKNKEGRYVYAGINPHAELTASQIIVEGDDGKLRLRFSKEAVLVEVEKELVIDENFLVEPGKGLGWQQHDPDDDANIEI